MQIDLRPAHARDAAARQLEAVMRRVPRTAGCWDVPAGTTFALPGPRGGDPVAVAPALLALAIEHGRVTAGPMLRWEERCGTPGCIATDPGHLTLVPDPASTRPGRTADGLPVLSPGARERVARPLAPGYPSGEGRFNARLTEEQARAIQRLRFDHGWTYSRIAREMGLPMGTVIGALNGHSWRVLLQDRFPELSPSWPGRSARNAR